MKKKILKRLLLIIVGLFSFMSFNVHAQTDSLRNGNVVDIPYYYTHHRANEYYWDSFRYITRLSDGEVLYCIQPLVHIDNDAVYDVKTSNMAAYANIDDATFDKIAKIAYYGYSYVKDGIDHSDARWYAAAQMMIWRLADPSVDAYFTHSIRGPRDDSILKTEILEIERLVEEHDQKPVFSDLPKNIYIGDTLTINDEQGILSNYTVSNVKGGIITKSGNTLTLKSQRGNNLNFTLNRNFNYYNEPFSLYYSDSSQMSIRRGNLSPQKLDYKIYVEQGRINICKRDDDTKSKNPLGGDATLQGAVFGLYNMDGTKIMNLTTSSGGCATSSLLSRLGDFYVQEITPSKGYTLNKDKFVVSVTKDNLYPSITIYEKIIKRKIKLIKVYESSLELYPEENITFDFILASTGKKYTSASTNKDGTLELELPYGKYIVRQVNTLEGYNKMDDFEIEVKTENDGDFIKYIANRPIEARVKVLKKDRDTNEVIKLAGMKFKIKNKSTNEFVCENDDCIFETNSRGEFLSVNALLSGNYELIEVDAGNSLYALNKTPLEFEINADNFKYDKNIGNYIEVDFFNELVKGQISINKMGQKLVIEDGTYRYVEVPLDGVEYEVRAGEDIYVNGKLYYSKNDLVEVLKTDELGNVRSSILPLGLYTLREIKSSHGNLIDGQEHVVELNYDGPDKSLITKTFDFKNVLPKATLSFLKKASDTDSGLGGAHIEIYTERDELIFSGMTNRDGKIEITDLPLLKFYLIETLAPDGYEINTSKLEFELKFNGEVIDLEMLDKKIPSLNDILDSSHDKDNNYQNPSNDIDDNQNHEESNDKDSSIKNEVKIEEPGKGTEDKVLITKEESIREQELLALKVPNTFKSKHYYINIITGIVGILILRTHKKEHEK